VPTIAPRVKAITQATSAVPSVQPSPAMRYWRYDPEAPGSRSKKIPQFQLYFRLYL
jgi:hypothetical protein